MVRVGQDQLLVVVEEESAEAVRLGDNLRILQQQQVSQFHKNLESALSESAAHIGTLSIGVAQVEDCKDLDAALKKAQRALADAGKSGNQVSVHPA